MAYDEAIADRIRDHLSGLPSLTERKMFGGLAFMVNGNMACGPVGDALIVRVGPEAYDDALSHPEADEMKFTGRPMRGFVEVEIGALEKDELLLEWVCRGVDFASSLPAK